VVERLQKDYPNCNVRLVIGSSTGSNRKASVLHHLAAQANHQILAISDSDMRVTPDYLRRVVAPLADEQIGLVTCPYRGESALTLPAQLEALHMGTIFLPSVVIASRLFRFQFAMGSTMALRRRDLDRMGGFRAIADYLADDYHLGASMAGLGLRVHRPSMLRRPRWVSPAFGSFGTGRYAGTAASASAGPGNTRGYCSPSARRWRCSCSCARALRPLAGRLWPSL
jgi:cellulose synthase/poly-beta-1,6-N-acetylglucosamine synthase-like glycosyltransferase